MLSDELKNFDFTPFIHDEELPPKVDTISLQDIIGFFVKELSNREQARKGETAPTGTSRKEDVSPSNEEKHQLKK